MEVNNQSEELANLTGEYVRLRDQRAQLKADYEKQDEVLEFRMDKIRSELLEVLKTTGASSIRTEAGTITRTVRTKYWTSDWDEFYKLMARHEAYHLLEKRIAQSSMKEFLEEHPEEVPPGLNVDSKYDVIVRRGKNV